MSYFWEQLDDDKLDPETSKEVQNEDPNDVVDDVVKKNTIIDIEGMEDVSNDDRVSIFEEEEEEEKEENSTTDKIQINESSKKHKPFYVEVESDEDTEEPSSLEIHKTEEIATESFLIPKAQSNSFSKIALETFNVTLEEPDKKPLGCTKYRVFRTPKEDSKGYIYSSFIYGIIDEIPNFVEVIDCLENATENDDVYLFIESPGGYVSTGAVIASVIEASLSNVYTVAVGEVASAASLIWSSGKHCIVKLMAMLMYHMSSHCDSGNSELIRKRAADLVRYVEESLLSTTLSKGHITKEEVREISETATNKWIDGEVIEARLKMSQGDIKYGNLSFRK